MYRIGLMALALVAAPVLAQANSISFVEITTVQQPGGFGPSGPPVATSQNNSAAPGDVTVGTTPTFGGFVEVEATQNADGTSEVRAETQFNGENTQLNTALARFTQSETNTTGMARNYSLSYALSGMSARLNHGSDFDIFGTPPGGGAFVNPFGNDFSTLIFSNFTAASFQYLIEVNGTEVFSARADALVSEAGGSTQNVSGFTPTLIGTPGQFRSWEFLVSDISGTIDLGTFGAGANISVVTTLIAQSYATNVRGEIRNWVGSESTDPVNLSSTGTLQSSPAMAPVPLPAAGWLMVAGLGGLAALRRRKRA